MGRWVQIPIAALAATWLASSGFSLPRFASGDDNPWHRYRGNLHTHTLWSDGDDYPEMVALWYRDHGYDFVSFSDHNTLWRKEKWIDPELKGGSIAYNKLKAQFPNGWIDERTTEVGRLEVKLKTFDEIAGRVGSPGNFVMLQGEEITDFFHRCPVHFNATNLREAIPPMGGDSVRDVIQRNTNALIAQRERTGQPMAIHVNHPNFQYGVTAEDLARIHGANLFEVYNGHTQANNNGSDNNASAERIWDIILTRRIGEFHLPLVYGLATDDAHEYHNIPSRANEPGRGWVVVIARELTPTAIIKSLERGMFYSSTGVTLDRIAPSPRGIEVHVHPEEGVEYTIDFIGTQTGYDRSSEPVKSSNGYTIPTTRRYSNDIGRILKTETGSQAEYVFAPTDLYVRARVTSTKKHPNPSATGEYERAWGQPVRGPAGWRFRPR
jgi:hypothetical protein